MSPPAAHIALNAQLLCGRASYRSAGIHNYIDNLLKHLPAADPDLRYTVFVGEGQPQMPLDRATVRRTRLPTIRPPARIFWEQFLQPFELSRAQPDLLHSLAFVSPMLAPCPAVVTVYDLSFKLFPERFLPAQRLYLSAFTAYSCRRARRVIAISESTKADLIRVFSLPAEKVDVAYPGISPAFRPLPPAEVEVFRARRGLPGQFILYLGTLEPRKNLGALLRAFAQVARAQRDLHLVLAGAKGWLYADLFKLTHQLGLAGRVIFPGFVPTEELPLWYNSATVFAYPSSYEGFGLPVSEALACGRPVVTSNVSSLPEAGGQAAILVAPEAPEALAEALSRALSWGPAERALGPVQAAPFTWAATAAQTVRSYWRALGVTAPPVGAGEEGGMSNGSRRSRRVLLRLLLDIGLINLAFALAYYVRYVLELFVPVNDANRAPYAAYLPFQFWYTVFMLLFLYLDGVYVRRRGGSWFDESYRIANATTSVGMILIAATFIILPLVYSRLLIGEAALFTIVLLAGARLVQRMVQAQLRRRGHGVDRVLIVGAGESGRAVMRSLVALPDLGFQVVGFVDDDPAKGDIGRFKALGGLDNVGALLKSERVDEVIITLPWMYQRQIISLVRACEAQGVRARVVPDLFQLTLNQVDFADVGGIPLIGIKEATISRTGRLVKRGLDILVAAIGLTLGAPVMALAIAAIKLESPGPAVFKQTRIGENGRPFSIYKLRSMCQDAEAKLATLRPLNEADGPLFKMRDDPRITRVGKILRRTSLDEVPQLVNILRGEMSLVGPRSALPDEVSQYQPWHRQRLEVPQGLTGLWQVSGRSELTFDEMCLLDIYYIENWSIGLDLMILLRTIPRVLFGSGAY